jgi:membrane protein DedA with SNARE-associated domain
MDRVHPCTAFVALGALGLVLSALVLGTLVWMLQDYGIINPDNPSLISWITLIVIGIIFGIGLSWSLLRARVTGQVEVD